MLPPCLEILSESSSGSLVFLKDHSIFLVSLSTFPSILFYFDLGKLVIYYLLNLFCTFCTIRI